MIEPLVYVWTQVANTAIIAAYLTASFLSLRAISRLKAHADFSRSVLKDMAEDAWRLLRNDKFDVKKLGGAGLWIAASLSSTANFMFALMHVQYMLSGDVFSVGFIATNLWFATHITSLGATAALILYAVKEAEQTDGTSK